MFIDKITLRNFKGFENYPVEFKDRFTIIVGNNGLGKTSILDSLAIASSVYFIPFGCKKAQRTINKRDVRVVSSGDSFEPQLPCVIEASRGNMTWSRSIETQKFTNLLGKNNQLVTLAREEFNRVSSNETVNLPVFAYHGTGRLWAEYSEHVDYTKQGSRTEGWDFCLSAKSSSKAFRSWYKTLEKNADKKNEEIRERLRLFREAIISCVEDWDDFYYDFAENDIIGISKKGGNTTSLPYSMMSDGYRNMIGMVADIAYRCIRLNPHLGSNAIKETEGLVLIDEIDLHLHPTWQRKVVKELSLAFPKIQFVVTSHSPFILQSATANQVVDLAKRPLNDDPRNVSLELNARYMGVESVNGVHFSEKEKAAEQFFKSLQQAPLDKEAIEAQFRKLSIEYSNDPAYVALLKLEKVAQVPNQ